MRYIGGKSLLIEDINMAIKNNTKNVRSVFDVFAGTGVVSQSFKANGYRVLCNDFLYFSYALQRCKVGINKKPTFSRLGFDPIEYLNQIKITDTRLGEDELFVYNNYSPANGCERMYFQPNNAMKIDLIRLQIQEWFDEGKINENEYYYLIASLIEAVPFVANITGVYAAYLKFWDKRTYLDLELMEPQLIDNGQDNVCFNNNIDEIIDTPCDLIYADPPYNSREYLPNYHILETIAKYDYPVIHGVTGIREYDDQKSDFCKKRYVEDAFDRLIGKSKSRYLVISYNNEGLISTDKLSEICNTYAKPGSFKLFEYDYRRYKNKIPNNKAGLKEQIYFLEKK